MSRADALPDELTHGEWADPATPPRLVMPDRRISTGCRSELASETCLLLHQRLRAASLMLAVAFAVLTARDVAFSRDDLWRLLLHGSLASLLVGNYALLKGRWK